MMSRYLVKAVSRMNVVLSCIAFMLLALFAPKVGAQRGQYTLSSKHLRDEVFFGSAQSVGPLPVTQRMHLSLVLPLRNETKLNKLLSRLYDPSSPDYRHFLSVPEFTEQFGPTAEQYQAVVDFAHAQGFEVGQVSANRVIVDVSGTVTQVEKAFNVKMKVYKHPTENRNFFSPDHEPSIEANIPLLHITGLNNFSIPRPMLSKLSVSPLDTPSSSGSGPGLSFLPSDMRAAYYGGTALTGSGQVVGLMEFGGYNLSDVTSTFDGHTYSVPINNVLINGATAGPGYCDTGDPGPAQDDIEQVLDIAQAIGMAPGLSQVRVYIAPCPWTLTIDDAAVFNKMATENIAKQISVSWYWSPDDPSVDDVFFKEFSAQGQSIFVASGDAGAYTSSLTSYPAEDLYVTAVGGTDLHTNLGGGPWQSETAWSYSGGGPSPDGMAIPSWQSGVANASNHASTSLRNVPDVAMEANNDNYVCHMGTCTQYGGGTSYAAPRWAGFMALINQQAVANGEAPTGGLGFINPAIYTIGKGTSYQTDFHDITSGSNTTYTAVSGYDLVTGWGSPNGQAFINALAPPTTASPNISSESWAWSAPVHHLIVDSFTITDPTPGASIAWSMTTCNNQTGGGTVSSGGTVQSPTITPACTVTLTMRASAPGYAVSQTITEFYTAP